MRPASKQPEYTSPTRPQRSGSKQLAEDLSKDELLKRLKKISQELMVVEGENIEKYKVVAESLGKNFILKHADKDIRLYGAYCLAQILRLFVPNSPYDKTQLWGAIKGVFVFGHMGKSLIKRHLKSYTIFDLIISQLEGLRNPKGSYFDKLFNLLENLSYVNTLTICIQLDFPDLILKFFTTMFNSVSEEHRVKIPNIMLDIMLAVLEEAEAIPQALLDKILENIINPRKTTHPAAYKLASTLIQKASNFLEPSIQLFFNNALFFDKSVDSELDEHLFDLIYELHKICPSVLLSVLPQLEFKLKSDKEAERLDVTTMLGKMFSDEDSDLAKSHKPLWHSYLGRFIDKDVSVRVEITKQAKYFLLNHPELVGEISGKLRERQRDPDEKVRMEVVTTICEAASENIECIPDKLFDIVTERLRDRKIHIRKDTMMCLGRLYKKISGSEPANPKYLKKISWIPIKILHCYYQNTVEDRLCVERAFLSCLVPLTLGSKERMKRLFKLFLKLDEPGTKAFKCMFKLQASLRSDMNDILKSWEEHQKTSSTEAKKILTSKISIVAGVLPEPGKAQEHVKKLVKMFSDKKLFALMKTCLGGGQDCASVTKAVSSVAISIGAKNPAFEAVKALLDRAAPLLIDATAAKHLVNIVSKCVNDEDMDGDEDTDEDSEGSQEETAERAMDLLLTFASIFPTEFRSSLLYEMILVNLSNRNSEIADTSLQILTHVGEGLYDIDKNVCSHFQQVLSKMFTTGTLFQVKLAARAIKKIYPDSAKIFQKILENQCQSLNYDCSNLVVNLSCLSQISLLEPTVFERHYTTVVRDFVVRELLMKDRGSVAANAGPMWCDEDDLSKEIKAKIQGLKLLVNWLRGLHTKETAKIQPVLRILDNVLKSNGDVTKRGHLNASERSHMKLTAAQGLLKLAPESEYHEFIDIECFQTLSSIMQDPSSDVRMSFTKRLCKGLESLKLPLEYLALFALTARESSDQKKQQIKLMFGRCIHVRNEYLKHHSSAPAHSPAILPEYALPYLIYLLSHLPKIKYTETQSLKHIKTYLWFFLEAVLAKGDNFNFLKKLAENIKLTKDARAPDDKEVNKAIYTVSDIAIGIILNLSKARTYLLKDYAGNLVLPKKLFTPLTKLEAERNMKSYLPKGFVISPVKTSGPPRITPIKHSLAVSNAGKKRTTTRSRVPAKPKSQRSQRSLMDILNKKAEESDEDTEENKTRTENESTSGKTSSSESITEKRQKRAPTVPMNVGRTTRSSPRRPAESLAGVEKTTKTIKRNLAETSENESSSDAFDKNPFDRRIMDTIAEKGAMNDQSSTDDSKNDAVTSDESRKRKNIRESTPPEKALDDSSVSVRRKRKRR